MDFDVFQPYSQKFEKTETCEKMKSLMQKNRMYGHHYSYDSCSREGFKSAAHSGSAQSVAQSWQFFQPGPYYPPTDYSVDRIPLESMVSVSPGLAKMTKWMVLEPPQHPQTQKLCGKRCISIVVSPKTEIIFFRKS